MVGLPDGCRHMGCYRQVARSSAVAVAVFAVD